ncbi:MAG: site-2 protease family protein [Armatimonadetes bacterium]|nr:site-2 protease family protein [Armatimonadota bacterium]
MVIQTTIALVFIFAVLVMFHELGHFIAARLVGIKIEEFSFGFGPKLIRLFKRGDTDYTWRLVPLGGFVRLTGMEPGDENIPDSFQAQAIWKRALVIFCGPFASFLLAVIVFVTMGVFWGYPIGSTQNKIGMVIPQTEAARIGLRAGDRILEIDGVKISDGKQMVDFIHDAPGKDLSLLVERNGSKQTLTAVPRWSVTYLGASWSFMDAKQGSVDGVYESSPAKSAGIEPNDKLISLNGKQIGSGEDFIAAIQDAGEKQVTIELKRNDETISAKAVPPVGWVRFMGTRWAFPGAYADKVSKDSPFKYGDELVKINGAKVKTADDLLRVLRFEKSRSLDFVVGREDGEKPITVSPSPAQLAAVGQGVFTARGLLGFQPEQTLVKAGFVESVGKGLLITKNIAAVLIQTLTTKRIKDEVGGPVMIAKMTSSAVARGSYWVLQMLGGLSMSLAFINLIPIPAILDGGHLILLFVEGIRRKRWTIEQMRVFQMIGFAILVVLVVTVLWSDIFKISRGLVPQ